MKQQANQDFDDLFCIFCFKDRVGEVTHHSLPRPVPVCDSCARDVRQGRLTAEDLRDRLEEVRAIGVLT